MTKLMQWLAAAVAFMAVWLPVLLDWTPVPVATNPCLRWHLWALPVYLVAIFGAISAVIVLYRVMTFNDCPDAYKELQKQIHEARDDLTLKGFKFDDQTK